jgi:hypothetical protein
MLTMIMNGGSQMDRWASRLISVLLILALFLTIGLFVLTVLPSNPVPKLIMTVHPAYEGKPLYVRVDYCKVLDVVPDSVQWSLHDDVTVMLAPTIVTLPLGCHVTTVVLPTPPQMVAGVYSLEVAASYSPLPWKTVIVRSVSEPFTVR